MDYLGKLVRLGLLLPAMARDLGQGRRHWKLQWKYATIVGVVSPVFYVLVLCALQMAPLGHVTSAPEVSMLFVVLFGGHLLGEVEPLFQLSGAASIAVGA